MINAKCIFTNIMSYTDKNGAHQPMTGRTRSSWLRGYLITSIIFFCTASFSTPLLAEQTATLNLKDANIMVLVEMVSEITGKNFIVDPRVRGKVTVVSNQPLNAEEVYQVFVSILEVHGFATVPNGDVIKIVPENKARFDSIPSTTGRSRGYIPSDQMVTRVIKVKNVSATQLVPILRPLIPQQGHLAAHSETNTLVISDKANNVERLANIVAGMDQDSENDIELVPLKHAAAAEIVRMINGLSRRTGKDSANNGPAKLAADDRTNSVMVSGSRAERKRLKKLIGQLDTPVAARRGNTHVVYLKYAKAKDLIPVLTGIAKDNGSSATQTKEAPTLVASRKVSIQADEPSNSLVITASPKTFADLQDVIRQLDIRRAQVMVEAIIAEVSLDKSKSLGVEWIVDGGSGNAGPVGVVNFSNASGISGIASALASGGVPSVGEGGTIGLGIFDSSNLNFAVLAKALAGDATTNILSTPSLLTLDNQPAEIIIGQNVPFVTGEYAGNSTGTNSVNPFRTIQREDVGLTLRVTPQINEGGAIQLELEQEVSSISASAVGASDLITNKRVIKTTVMIDDGSTVVLGGLMDENLQHSQQKVPLLGDLPIVGGLFRSNTTTKTKRDLMIFLRPTIVRDAATQNQVTGSKYNYIRAQQQETRRRPAAQLAPEENPLLPQHYPEIPHPFETLSPFES